MGLQHNQLSQYLVFATHTLSQYLVVAVEELVSYTVWALSPQCITPWLVPVGGVAMATVDVPTAFCIWKQYCFSDNFAAESAWARLHFVVNGTRTFPGQWKTFLRDMIDCCVWGQAGSFPPRLNWLCPWSVQVGSVAWNHLLSCSLGVCWWRLLVRISVGSSLFANHWLNQFKKMSHTSFQVCLCDS